MWLVEAALNYSYCKTYENMPKYSCMQLDSTEFIFNTKTDVKYSEVIEIYKSFAAWFEITKNNYASSDMIYSIADVYVVENVLRVKVLIEYGAITNLKSTQSYTIVGDWKWGKKLGNCSGQYVGLRDASTEINSYLQSVLNPMIVNESCYYINVASTEVSGTWVEPNLYNLIWYNEYAINYDYCMPESVVRNWAQKSVIAQQNARTYFDYYYSASGRKFKNCVFASIGYQNIAFNYETCFHILTEYYAIKIYDQHS